MPFKRLNPAEAVILIADLQEGIVNVASTNDGEQLRRSAAALVRAGALFEIPIIFSVVPTMGGTVSPLLEEISEAMPGAVPLTRRNADAFADPVTRAALTATGRRTLIVAGVATEIAVQLPALAARAEGYGVYAVIDACSGLDARTEDAALRRMTAAGVITTSVATLVAEIGGDFSTDRGRTAMEILGSILPPRGGHDHEHDHNHDLHDHHDHHDH